MVPSLNLHRKSALRVGHVVGFSILGGYSTPLLATDFAQDSAFAPIALTGRVMGAAIGE